MIFDIAALITDTIDSSPTICAALNHTIADPRRFRERAPRDTPFPFCVFLNTSGRTEFAADRSYIRNEWWDIHVYGSEDDDLAAYEADQAILEEFAFLPPQVLTIGRFDGCLPTSDRQMMDEMDGPYGKIRVNHRIRTYKFMIAGRIPPRG